ncbi:DUF1080 domain-containing protein [Colwellia sp. 6_MG-2023]|uniref:3-keto-disaccharide hydrolase n=1 Tax=Colwellia sp. 6_MG-2023 TaxID=3062676 RepID=UPI0026E1ED7C|nr:DUF1080 domain-containing protein [Colwellia sp. 6_MG-2023]MDO6487541.1 DUF1080 domain-containing protein [Colwellia sp. 6_MG-2023]
MKCFVKVSTNVFMLCLLLLSNVNFAFQSNDATEPTVDGKDTIELLTANNFSGWKVPSANWSVIDNAIIGSTGNKKLSTSEWLYTEQRFKDFEFTCEVKLTGDDRRNSGIYFRVNTFLFKSARGSKSFEAPSGYEFDLARHTPEKRNY